jgi:hypothetical protein
LSSGSPRPLAAVRAAVGNPLVEDLAGPASAAAELRRLRGFAGIDEPANVTGRHAEQCGDLLNVIHGGRRVRPGVTGCGAGGGNVGTHVEFSK